MCKIKVLMAVLVTLLVLPVFVPTARADTVLGPIDDTYVDLSIPSANLDGGRLVVSYSNQPDFTITRRAYLRFHLGSVTGPLTGATLRLYIWYSPRFTTNGYLAVYSTADDWNGAGAGNGDETTLTWNNAPAPMTLLATAPTGAQSTWMEFSGLGLTSYLESERQGDDIASLIVQWHSATVWSQQDNIVFDDREAGGTTTYPQLVLYGPTACDLASFSADPLPGAVDVRWETATEADLLGFDLYRADDPQGEPVRLNEGPIPSKQPGSPFGAWYRFVDQSLEPGVVYYYWLDWIHFDGSTSRIGPVSAAAGLYRFYLPLVFRSGVAP